MHFHKKYRGLKLEDFLIKPVQRLPKYVIVLKELKKRTCHDHPDYENICKLLEAFEKVNGSNNDKLNKVLNNFKLTEIESELDITDVTGPGVDFVCEEPATLLTSSHKSVEAIMYILNNQIILKKFRHPQLLARVWINHGASVME